MRDAKCGSSLQKFHIIRKQVGEGLKEAQKLRTLSTMCTQGGGGKGSEKPQNLLRTMYIHGLLLPKIATETYLTRFTHSDENLVLCVMQVFFGTRYCY